jgi:signal transduction histidine kinase/ligand-binding sensor domain-containing protein
MEFFFKKRDAANFITYFFLVVFVFAVYENEAHSQIKELRFTAITTEQGLSSNIINCIAQDNNGFMWFGTAEGLNRYNGYTNKIFKKDLYDSTSLSDNIIYDIFIDNSNNSWIATHNGLNLYNPDKLNFTHIPFPSEWSQYYSDNRISKIRQNSNNELYVSAEAGYLFHVNRNKTLVRDNHDFRSIKTFIIDKQDRFWIGGIFGLYCYDINSGDVKHYNSFTYKDQKFDLTEINTIFEDGDTIWVGTVKGRILYILKQDMKVRTFEHDLKDAYFIYDIFKSSNNLIYISTTSGLHIYDKKRNHLVSYTYEASNLEGISGIGITKVFEDRQKNLWVGTYQGGINFAVAEKAFVNYNRFSKEMKLDIANINAICEDSKGNLWLGSFDLGINVINPKTGERKMYFNTTTSSKTPNYGTVHTIFEDSKKNIWIGTYLGYLQKFDPHTGVFKTYRFPAADPNPTFMQDVRSIAEDKDGNLWIVSHGHGLVKFNPETGKIKVFKRSGDDHLTSLADDWAYQVVIDHQGMIWIATPSGLSQLNPLTEHFRSYYNNPEDSTTLGNNFINTIYEDSYFNLWIGTSYGLDMFNRNTRKFVHFYEKDGLPNSQIKSIVEYYPGNLWIGTGKGLSNLKYKQDASSGNITATFRNYDRFDNLQDNLYWKSAAIKTKEGKLIFGGEKGIVVFDPTEIKNNTWVPNVFITDFKLFNKAINIGEYDSILKKDILFTKEITLKYSQNYFTFEFAAINYVGKQKCQYKYKMVGVDKDWNITDNLEATYTNLDPGNYVFTVTASNSDGNWNEKGVSLEVKILPPFWKIWWFRILLFLVVVLLIFSMYYFKTKILRERNVALEQRVTERTQKLSELNNELIDKNEKIIAQNSEIHIKNEEINTQKEHLEEQKNKVEKAYEELSLYRNKLEKLVEERTKELMVAKEKAEESDKLKTSFLSNLSHEVRTPLNSIVGFSNIVFDEDLTHEEKIGYKKLVEESCFSLLSVINDIIDYSKIEAGDIQLDMHDLSVQQIISGLDDIFHFEHTKQNFYKPKNLEFKLNVSDEAKQMLVHTDEQRLKQILTNLISNAIKFTMEGYVEFGCQFLNNNQTVEFYLKDTGIGIKREDHEIIFQRFRKIENDSLDLFRGTGIGLSIVKQLVHVLGGQIRLESEINHGSTFYISLPTKIITLGINPVIVSVVKPESSSGMENKTILVAEDDMGNYIYLEKVLRKSEARIIHAFNGKEALDILDANPHIDLVLMDIKMPVMNGMDALAEIRRRNIDIPVIAQTAYAFADEILRIREAGFTDYISKPILAKDLFLLISKYLH